MTEKIALSCACGTLTGTLDPSGGTLITCYCRDCRAYARHLGAEDALDAHGGTTIFQTTPDRIEITQGADQLRLLRLSPKGLFRWYTACCGTPIANTLARPGIRFCGLPTGMLVDPANRAALGPSDACVATKYADPPGELTDKGVAASGLAILRRAVMARLRGGTARPFFDEKGRPVADPALISLDDKSKAYGATS